MVHIPSTGQPRRLRRRREILKAASEVFREKGFHSSGMRDIAGVLGIAVGKLYYWFESKQELLAFCQRDTLERLHRMVEAVRELPIPVDAILYLVIRGHIRCLNQGTVGSLAHLEAESLEVPWRGPILSLRNRYERSIQEIIARGLREGVLADIDPKLGALGILGAVNWTVKWYRPGGRRRLLDIEHAFARAQVRGLLAEGRRFEDPDPTLLPDSNDEENGDE